MFQLTLWSIPPLVAVLVTLGLIVHTQTFRNAPGVAAFRLLLVIVVVWCGVDFLDSIIIDTQTKLLLAKLRMCVIALAPVAWFAFALSFASRRAKPPRAALNAASLVPLTTVALVVSSELHTWIWLKQSVVVDQGYISIINHHGPWFYVHAAYSYLLIFGASTLLAFALHQAGHRYRPVTAVLAAPLVVGLANTYSLSDWNATPWFDASTLGFAIALIMLDKWVLNFGLLESHPVARDRVVENLAEGVVVINSDGAVIDINQRALQILQTNRSSITNAPIEDYVQSVPLTNLNARQRTNVEITLNQRAYDITSTALDPTSEDSDIAFVWRDVTARREADQRLRQLKTELEEMAHTDALTGLVNRRLFLSRLVEEVERVRRHGSTLSVVLFDLDHFKSINDTYGHDAGDRVLINVAKATTEIKRVTDVAARIGGEEFAILLPETAQSGALHVANRLREGIEAIHTRAEDGTSIRVTTSVGLATVRADNRDLEDILKLADGALYRAKNSGRNRICAA